VIRDCSRVKSRHRGKLPVGVRVQDAGLSNKTADKVTVTFLDSNHREAWDDFCLQSSDAWFWHTTKWLDYTLDYRPELAPISHSFLVFADGEIAAICPLVLETSREPEGDIRQFSYGGDAVPAPAFADGLSTKTKKDVRKALFRQVDELAIANRVHRISFRVAPPAPFFWRFSHPQQNPLVHEGFSDISLLTQVIDLSQPADQLLQDMRKGHRANVKRAEKIMSASVFDSSNITRDQFERYRMLHHKAAGRTTRPLSTFEMMHRWIQDGLAVLTCATLEGRDVGFALISIYKDGAYYSSGCADPEFNDLPIGHLLQWRTMQWLKAHEIRHYEIGIQFYSSQPHAMVSRKEWNISFFKRGFGGFTVPYWRAEKFYDEVYCRRVLEERAALYSRSLSSPGDQPDE
jgi:Acetyltransferase (GNAT) domain